MRWYILAEKKDCDCKWEITSWSRSKILASHKAEPGGHFVYARNRQRAAAIAKNLWDLDVDTEMKERKS